MKKIFDLFFILLWTSTLIWLHHTGALWIYFEDQGYISESSTGMRFFIMLITYVLAYIVFVVLIKTIYYLLRIKKESYASSSLTFSMVIVFFSLMVFADTVIEIRRENSATECPAKEAVSNQFCYFKLKEYTPLLNSFYSVYGGLGGKSGGIREPWYQFYITLEDKKTKELYPIDLGTAFVDRHSANSKNIKILQERKLKYWQSNLPRKLQLIRSRDAYDEGIKKSYLVYLYKNHGNITGLNRSKLSSKVFTRYYSSTEFRHFYWYIKRIGFWAISILYCFIALIFISMTFTNEKKDD